MSNTNVTPFIDNKYYIGLTLIFGYVFNNDVVNMQQLNNIQSHQHMPHLPSPFTIFPPTVLNHLNSIFWNYSNSKFSFSQLSHRSQYYGNINNQSQELIRKYFQVTEDYQIIYLPNQAGFAALPFNLNRIVNEQCIYVVNDAESQFAYKQAFKINYKTQKVDNLSKRKQISSKFSSKFYTFYNKISLETGAVHQQPQALPEQILICNVNYCSHFQKVNIKNHGIVLFDSGRGFGLTGMTVVIVRKDLIGFQLGTCPDMMCFQKSITAKSIINTPYTFVPLLFAEYITYCLKEGKGLKEVSENLKEIKKQYVQALGKKTKVVDTQSNGVVIFKIGQECQEQRWRQLGWKFGDLLTIILQQQNKGKGQEFTNLIFK